MSEIHLPRPGAGFGFLAADDAPFGPLLIIFAIKVKHPRRPILAIDLFIDHVVIQVQKSLPRSPLSVKFADAAL
jgi:hypothetical protein